MLEVRVFYGNLSVKLFSSSSAFQKYFGTSKRAENTNFQVMNRPLEFLIRIQIWIHIELYEFSLL